MIKMRLHVQVQPCVAFCDSKWSGAMTCEAHCYSDKLSYCVDSDIYQRLNEVSVCPPRPNTRAASLSSVPRPLRTLAYLRIEHTSISYPKIAITVVEIYTRHTEGAFPPPGRILSNLLQQGLALYIQFKQAHNRIEAQSGHFPRADIANMAMISWKGDKNTSLIGLQNCWAHIVLPHCVTSKDTIRGYQESVPWGRWFLLFFDINQGPAGNAFKESCCDNDCRNSSA
mmetsp:Transcript_21648/g.63574  ORF Transcript_21648/g.63574 Transcript_21648/m.63574 type:complete len:227 (-) Transcript_21648:2940-3620(-)